MIPYAIGKHSIYATIANGNIAIIVMFYHLTDAHKEINISVNGP